MILKSREFHLESQVRFQTKIAQQEVQSPLYYSRFEIAEFSQSQYFFFTDQLAGLLKSETKSLLHLILYLKQKWYDIKRKWYDLRQKWCDLEHEWRDLE